MVALLPLLAAIGMAEAPRVYTIEDGATAPRVIDRTAPEYTEQARLARLNGTVVVKLIVEPDGTLRDVHVSKAIGLGLDEKAVEAVKCWQFAPGSVDGKPVAVLTTVPVNFQLLAGRSDWRTTGAAFDGPEVTLENAQFVEPTGAPAYATVSVSFDIDAQGEPRNMRVENSTDASRNDEVMGMVRRWRFQPGTPSHCTLDFARGKSATS